MVDEGTAVALAKWLFAAEHGCPPEEIDAVLGDPLLSLPAAGIADALERQWVPFARAVLADARRLEHAAAGPTARGG